MNLTIEKVPVIAIDINEIEKFKNLIVLGIYVYIKMLMYNGITSTQIIVEKIRENFSVGDEDILNALEFVLDKGFFINININNK